MAVNLSPIWGAGAQLLDNSGNVLTGGKIYTYLAGTTTPAVTYTSNNGGTANSNPIILNAAGRVPYEIWLTDGIEYKFVLKDSNDTLIGTWDNLIGINSNFINYYGQQEIQTATAGQTVFSLTEFEYQPGTGNLSVFVDGVNQYGPGAQYAYVETDSTTVTFVSGLHVGASVKFTTTKLENPGVADASQVTYTPPFSGSVTTNVEAKLAQYVSVKDFGAVGDGVTDDTDAIQNAIDAVTANGGGGVFFPSTANYYKCANGIEIKDSVQIFGYGFTPVTFTNASSVGDIKITGNNTGISGLKITSTSQQCVYFAGTNDNCIIENNYFYNAGSTGIAIHVNTADVNNIFVQDSIIEGGGYGVLLNANATGQYFLIADNVITHCKCIEVNTLGGYMFVNIQGNILDTFTVPAVSDAFAIGIAKGNYVNVVGNQIQYSSLEAIHIEDASNDVLVDSNTVITAGGDGIWIGQAVVGTSTNHVITNNNIDFVGTRTNEIGIRFVYDLNGSVYSTTVSGNRIKNFNRGIDLGQGFQNGFAQSSLCTNNIIQDCDIAIYGQAVNQTVFDNVSYSCPTAVQAVKGGVMGRLILQGTMPTTIATKTSNNLTIQGLTVNGSANVTGGVSYYFNVAPVPSAYLGDCQASWAHGGAWCAQVENSKYDGSTWTTINAVSSNYGVAVAKNFRVSGGYIQAGIDSASTLTYPVTVDLKGSYVI